MPAAASSRGSKAAFGESHLRVPLEGRRRGALERAAEARLRARAFLVPILPTRTYSFIPNREYDVTGVPPCRADTG